MRIKVNYDAIAWTLLILLGAQFMLFLVSWIISAAWPEAEVRSLLSSEALRWFMGGFVDNIASKPLVWILLLSMAYGIARESHIVDALKKRKMNSYRQTFALRIVLGELKKKEPEKFCGRKVRGRNVPAALEHEIDPAALPCEGMYDKTFFPVGDPAQNDACRLVIHDSFSSLASGFSGETGVRYREQNIPFLLQNFNPSPDFTLLQDGLFRGEPVSRGTGRPPEKKTAVRPSSFPYPGDAFRAFAQRFFAFFSGTDLKKIGKGVY